MLGSAQSPKQPQKLQDQKREEADKTSLCHVSSQARLLYVPAADHQPDEKRPIYHSAETFPRYLGDHMGPDYRPNADTKGYNVSEPIGYIDQAQT